VSKPKGCRQVHIGTEAWDYKFGKESVVIYSPAGVKTVVNYNTLTGQDWTGLDSDCKFPIGPSYVSEYILKNLFK
jgi:hypothetical protein